MNEKKQHTLILAFVIGFPIISMLILLSFLTVSSRFDVPDFVYIDYKGMPKEILVVKDSRFEQQKSKDYQRCASDNVDTKDSYCEDAYTDIADVKFYRYQNGTSNEIPYEELTQLMVSDDIKNPTQDIRFSESRCDSFGDFEAPTNQDRTCNLSIRKGSWQTKSVSVKTNPMIADQNQFYELPKNIYWITN